MRLSASQGGGWGLQPQRTDLGQQGTAGAHRGSAFWERKDISRVTLRCRRTRGWPLRPGPWRGWWDWMGGFCKSWGLRRMPDVPLKITEYVIFVLNQIASPAGFLGRQVISSAKGLKTHMGDGRGAGTENIPCTEVPGPRAPGQGHHCELLGGRLHPPDSEGSTLGARGRAQGGLCLAGEPRAAQAGARRRQQRRPWWGVFMGWGGTASWRA